MIQFLRNSGINSVEGVRKECLFQIIESHHLRVNQYKTDQFLSSKEHTAIHLLLDIYDLIPIELVWERIKSYNKNWN